MSSDDESAPSPEFCASSSKDRAPVTPNASESDDGDDSAKKKAQRYKRPRVKWDRVVSILKGADTEMDDDERNAQILHAARAFMEAGKIYKLPGQWIWVCGNKQKNGRPMADLLKFRCISAHSPVDSDVRPK